MCVHYRQAISPDSAARFFGQGELALSDSALRSNIESGDVWADKDGPVLIQESGDDDLTFQSMRWGFPHYKNPKDTIVNIRNLKSSWWRGVNGAYITEPAYRCLVPFNGFAEYSQIEKSEVFFEVDAPFPVFAGVWRPWRGERLMAVEGKKRRVRVEDDWLLFAFLTCPPNDVIAPHHPKAMPVILTTPEECARWMQGGSDTLDLQRPLPSDLVHRAETPN